MPVQNARPVAEATGYGLSRPPARPGKPAKAGFAATRAGDVSPSDSTTWVGLLYDLLHIAIFPHVGTASVRAFLLALKANGYRPQVIVTDLNQDYGGAIAVVFPQAEHHECVFHALQN